jgi:hypothetical protein
MRPGTGLDFGPRSPLNVIQMPANANRGRSSPSANHTTSFLPVAGSGSGAYSEKLDTSTDTGSRVASPSSEAKINCGCWWREDRQIWAAAAYPSASGSVRGRLRDCGRWALPDRETRPGCLADCQRSQTLRRIGAGSLIGGDAIKAAHGALSPAMTGHGSAQDARRGMRGRSTEAWSQS